jgi:hypothetical protein
MKKVDSIVVKQEKIQAHLNWIMFFDKGIFVGIIPTLNIAAKSDQEQKLLDELNGMVRNYFNHFIGEKLKRKLSTLGWENYTPPKIINLPIGDQLYDKMEFKVLEFSN